MRNIKMLSSQNLLFDSESTEVVNNNLQSLLIAGPKSKLS